MTPAVRRDVIRRLRAAARLGDKAVQHYAIGAEMEAEALRLLTEAAALEAGEALPPRARTVLDDLRH